MKKIFIPILLTSLSGFAFVSGPSSVSDGENYITLGVQNERGKIEPNENKASFQDAQIDLYKIKYVQGLKGLLGLSRSNIYFEFGNFNSSKEQVGTTLFYEKDQGSYFTIGLSGDFLHDIERQFGFYFHLSPSRSYNQNKFSNPRIDIFALGITSAFNITNNLFQRNLLHFGSGDSSSQNSYIALDSGFGYRINELIGRQFTILGSLFLEADTSERKDSTYDLAFSALGREDRIRSFKYGTLLGMDLALTPKINITLHSLQKLGGYDARSTQIYTLNVGFKF